MQTETVIIMIVGLLAIGLIRLVIAMVGREYAADHPHIKAKVSRDAAESGSTDLVATPGPRAVRGTGKKSHLLYLPSEPTPPTATPRAS
jgi:hypothetical protein